MKRLRVKLTNDWLAMIGLFGVGLLPCPDCGAPLAVHTWPIALLIWAVRRIRQRQRDQLDMLCPANQGEHQPDDAVLVAEDSAATGNAE